MWWGWNVLNMNEKKNNSTQADRKTQIFQKKVWTEMEMDQKSLQTRFPSPVLKVGRKVASISPECSGNQGLLVMSLCFYPNPEEGSESLLIPLKVAACESQRSSPAALSGAATNCSKCISADTEKGFWGRRQKKKKRTIGFITKTYFENRGHMPRLPPVCVGRGSSELLWVAE